MSDEPLKEKIMCVKEVVGTVKDILIAVQEFVGTLVLVLIGLSSFSSAVTSANTAGEHLSY